MTATGERLTELKDEATRWADHFSELAEQAGERAPEHRKVFAGAAACFTDAAHEFDKAMALLDRDLDEGA